MKTIQPVPLKQKVPLDGKKKRVLIIAGPTAAGKTKLALSLASALGGEIVSADSCQVYRGMDIGTAKSTPEERALIAHHLIDICDIDQSFNVVEFDECVKDAFRSIVRRDNVPIIVGGSGFYIHTILYGPPQGPPSEPQVREYLQKQMNDLGPEILYERLQILDPDYAATISEYDRHKIIRALEIMALSERKVSDFPKMEKLQEHDFDFRCWFIYYPREHLYQRIETRCDEMVKMGFLDEVRELDKRGIRNNPSACQAIGYRQALDFLKTEQTEEDKARFIEEFKKVSRRYAKRQFTWFRKEPLFRWLNMDEHPMEKLKELILQDFEVGD